MALRVMAIARQEGLRVPQDLALVSVDDSARCVKVEPTLTSVAPDRVNATMGKVNARPRAEVH